MAVAANIGCDGALYPQQKLTDIAAHDTLPTLIDFKFLCALAGCALGHQRIAANLNSGVLRECEQLSCYFFIAAIDDADLGLYLGCGSTKRLAVADMRWRD